MRTFETDVVVVSAGTSGLAAAATVAELGKRVIVIERNGAVGGNGNLASGVMAVESRIQRMFGYDLTREKAYEEHMRFTHWTVDGNLVKKYIDRSADTIEWLESLGINFSGLGNHGVGMYYTHHIIKPEEGAPANKNSGYLVMRAIEAHARDLGAEFMLKTKAKKYILESGRVVGVLAEDPEGELEVRGKAVISCTGGYGAYWRAPMGIPLSGDGLKMAQEAGAEITEGTIQAPHFPEPKNGKMPKMSRSINAFTEQPLMIVNCLGERFVDEYMYMMEPAAANALLRQPLRMAFSVFDQATVDNYKK